VLRTAKSGTAWPARNTRVTARRMTGMVSRTRWNTYAVMPVYNPKATSLLVASLGRNCTKGFLLGNFAARGPPAFKDPTCPAMVQIYTSIEGKSSLSRLTGGGFSWTTPFLLCGRGQGTGTHACPRAAPAGTRTQQFVYCTWYNLVDHVGSAAGSSLLGYCVHQRHTVAAPDGPR
jgi:hypothetical protein